MEGGQGIWRLAEELKALQIQLFTVRHVLAPGFTGKMRSNSRHADDDLQLERLEFLQRKFQQLSVEIKSLRQELTDLADPPHRRFLASSENSPLRRDAK